MILPQELLRVRRRKEKITALYAGDEEVSLAKTLISVYIEHKGKTRGELKEALTDCEMLGYDYKLVRGLAALLEDSSEFTSRGVVNPLQARMAVFREVGRRVIAGRDDRDRIMSAVAFKMNVSTYDLDRSLYSDLIDEYELSEFKGLEPEQLVKYYNAALAVGVLVNSRSIILQRMKGDKEILQICQSLGDCSESGQGKNLKITIKKTRAAGYRAGKLVELLSKLLSVGKWSITAVVADPSDSKRKYNFNILKGDVGKLAIKPAEPVAKKTKVKLVVKPKKRLQIVDVPREAEKQGITEKQVKKEYADSGYRDFGDLMIAEGKLKEIKAALHEAPDSFFETYRKILRSHGVKNPLLVLESIGYSIEWNRDRKKSLVYKI